MTEDRPYQITSFAIAGPCTLRVTFDDNANRTIDFWPMLRDELCGPLRDRVFFERVRLDEENRQPAPPFEGEDAVWMKELLAPLRT